MQTKWGILICALAFALVLAGFLTLNQPQDSSKPENSINPENSPNPENPNNPGNSTGEQGMPISTAVPIFYSSSAVNSEEEALALFNQHETTKQNTIEKLSQSQQSQNAEIIKDMILFTDCATVEKRAWKNDQYWLGTNKPAYVIVTPVASTYENWKKNEGKIFVERIRHEGENITIVPTNTTTYEDFKKYLNQKYPGATETYWTETKLWIKYLVDDNGTVYWAGQHLTSQPWLE